MVLKKNNPIVIFETNYGNFEIELFKDKTPKTVENFINLVNKNFYDGIRFHRIIQNFMIQGGCPFSKDLNKKSEWGTGDAGYFIEDEFVYGLSNLRGTIAMANFGPNTNSSQFFINVVDNTYLDFNKKPKNAKHTVFGRVIKGMEIVDKISKIKTDKNDIPLNDVIIKKIYLKKV